MIKMCPCEIEYTGDRQTCHDCGQVWERLPGEFASGVWVRVERDAGNVVSLAERRDALRKEGK